MKKSLFLLLTLLISVQCFSYPVYEYRGLLYSIHITNEAYVEKWDRSNPLAFYSIPETMELYDYIYPVRGVKSWAFEENTYIENITIPSSVFELESSTFKGCTNLKTVKINFNADYIPPLFFKDCSKLTDIEMASLNSLYKIGWYAFEGCKSLKVIPFNESSSITTVFPSSLSLIDDGAFKSSGLLSIDFSNTPNIKIGEKSFANCEQLASIKFNSIDTIKTETFSNCKSLRTVHFPASLKYIDSDAFSGCDSLKSIWFEGKVEMERNVFKDCDALDSIVINAEWSYNLELIAPNNHCTLYVPLDQIDKFFPFQYKDFVGIEPIGGYTTGYYIEKYKWYGIGGIAVLIWLIIYIVNKVIEHKESKRYAQNTILQSDHPQNTDVNIEKEEEITSQTQPEEQEVSASVASAQSPKTIATRKNSIIYVILISIIVLLAGILGFTLYQNGTIMDIKESLVDTMDIDTSAYDVINIEEDVAMPSFMEYHDFLYGDRTALDSYNMKKLCELEEKRYNYDSDLDTTFESTQITPIWGINTDAVKTGKDEKYTLKLKSKNKHAMVLIENENCCEFLFKNIDDYKNFMQQFNNLPYYKGACLKSPNERKENNEFDADVSFELKVVIDKMWYHVTLDGLNNGSLWYEHY